MSIGDYNYNALPIHAPSGFGPACVSPFEFIAAAQMDKVDKPTALIPRQSFHAQHKLVREDKEEIKEEIKDDVLPLPEFLGLKTYLSLFYKPP